MLINLHSGRFHGKNQGWRGWCFPFWESPYYCRWRQFSRLVAQHRVELELLMDPSMLDNQSFFPKWLHLLTPKVPWSCEHEAHLHCHRVIWETVTSSGKEPCKPFVPRILALRNESSHSWQQQRHGLRTTLWYEFACNTIFKAPRCCIDGWMRVYCHLSKDCKHSTHAWKSTCKVSTNGLVAFHSSP